MQWLWTWGGISVGYRIEYALFTHDGRMVGRFYGDEVYGADGRYLGEIKQEDRLITDQRKRECCRRPFTPARSRCVEPAPDRLPLAIDAGCEEFPPPEVLSFRSTQIYLETHAKRVPPRHPQGDGAPRVRRSSPRTPVSALARALFSAAPLGFLSSYLKQQARSMSSLRRRGERNAGSLSILRRTPRWPPFPPYRLFGRRRLVVVGYGTNDCFRESNSM